MGSTVAGSVTKSRPVGDVQVRMPPGCWATLHRVWVFNAWLGLHYSDVRIMPMLRVGPLWLLASEWML
ncbi:hypothetical protein, partial [Cryobacterium mannosilyticum]|uniref:hypothetical protein n=1 Tax=Cryobacterium mannosilyticum TaxID=1259190 RepID=UPI001A7E6461